MLDLLKYTIWVNMDGTHSFDKNPSFDSWNELQIEESFKSDVILNGLSHFNISFVDSTTIEDFRQDLGAALDYCFIKSVRVLIVQLNEFDVHRAMVKSWKAISSEYIALR